MPVRMRGSFDSVGGSVDLGLVMKVMAPPEAQAFVRERGGHLYVWTDRTRCCGGAMTLLQTSLDPPEHSGDFHEFVSEGFKLHFGSGRRPLPDELPLLERFAGFVLASIAGG